MALLDGKKILILGVANEQSIAWGIAQALQREGATLGFTYMNEALEKRVRPLAESLGCGEHVFRCDVQSDAEITAMFEELGNRWGSLDGLVHAVAFADKKDLQNRFSSTSRAGFQLAMDVSAYSLIALAGKAEPLMREKGGAILTLSYLGAERVVSNYNVMGAAKAALESNVRYLAADLGQSNIRVNAISAGPIKTLAAYGIPHFKELLSQFAARAPLRRNVTQEDVAAAALFYLSNMSAAITGEVTYVDCGFNILGL
ncbi:MAG: enoyl-ACP reductase [Bdellovibrionota bacterium]|nr:MAG: enoyl-ACP reductase [Bdellovibrionota bacterium]